MMSLSEEEYALLSSVISGDKLDEIEFPPLQWAIPGIIPEGFGLLTGAPKSGKSWLVLGIVLAVSSGDLALGAIPTGDPRPALYLALEDGERRLQERSRKLLGSSSKIPARFHFSTAVSKANTLPLVRTWLKITGRQNPLVVIDTLGRIMPPAVPGESAYSRDYRVGADLKQITAEYPGATILVVHHVNKGTHFDWMSSTSGTNGLNGAADFTINLHRERNDDSGLLRVTGRDVLENEYSVEVVDGAWRLAGGSLQTASDHASRQALISGVSDRSAAIMDALAQYPDGAAPKDIAEQLGLAPGDASTYLRRLANSGRIKKLSRGLYICVESVESVESKNLEALSTHGDDTDTIIKFDTLDTFDTPPTGSQ